MAEKLVLELTKTSQDTPIETKNPLRRAPPYWVNKVRLMELAMAS